ncbi:MAG: hypothetical protein IIZ78_23700 [Clostridiales bacterium]|nr:hypothetical protein [Clostridiales bacterium]
MLGNEETRKQYNRFARETMKYRLLRDIRVDLQICELEGWNKTEYLDELKEMINQLGENRND